MPNEVLEIVLVNCLCTFRKPECLTIDDLLIKLDRKLEKEAGDRVSEQELSKIIVSKNVSRSPSECFIY